MARTRTPIRSVVFDLWGTLIPFPAPAARELVARMASALSVPKDDFARVWADDFDQRATGDLELSVRRVCAAVGVDASDGLVHRALELRTAFHRSCFQPRADAVATLRALRGQGIRLGLITDCSSEVPGLWAVSPLAPLIDTAVFSCTEGVKKPDARIYQLACFRLAVEPQECLYVGDGASDELRGATAVGMRAVQLRPGDTDVARWPHDTISALGEVLGLVFDIARR